MKTIPLKIYFPLVALLFFINVNAQQFTTLLKTLHTEYSQEKLYLQFDRSFYNPGETIWFKAYLFAGNFPSLLSKTIYTELTDAKGKVLVRDISPVIVSSAAGSITVPAGVSGTFFIRAYTKWMLNFDTAFLFTKAITVIPAKNATGKIPAVSPSKTSPVVPTSSSSFVMQFFPEGGDMVVGVASRVAFKATDRNGAPVGVEGEILDSKGEKVTSFSSIHDGMGKFTFTPKSGEQYKAVWKDIKGVSNEVFLRAAKANGIVLEADYPGDQIEFKIKYGSNVAPYPFVYVVAQMNQQQLYRAKANISKTMSSAGIIPTVNFPPGIVQLTVFTPDEQPLAERIVFVNLLTYSFTTNLIAAATDSGKRKQQIIELDVPDTIPCNLSVAVTDAELNPGQPGDNIYSHLLISSDIKGFVYNPAYYFSSEEDSVANHLDLVMMTNGWRRFRWEDLLAGQFPILKYLPENYISIEGKVKGLKQNTISEKEINGILELKDKRMEYLNTSLQPDGKFNFSGMVFYDTAKLFYQFNKDKKKTLTTRADFDIKSNLLSSPLAIAVGYPLLAGLHQPDAGTLKKIAAVYQQQSDELELYNIKTLKAVVVKSTIKSKQTLMDEAYTSGFFSSDPSGQSRTILPEDDPYFLSAQNLFSFLQGRVAGLQIAVVGNEASVTWRGFQTALFVDQSPQTSLSFETGKITEDPGYILSLPMSEIAMVKIFDPPFFGAGSSSSGGQGGAIAVYLKRGRTGSQMSKGLEYTLLPGYSTPKEFYSPDYSMPVQSNLPDYRSTLYWNPFIFTDKNNRRIVITFYNNDFTKKMKVIMEGCNEDGKLTRVEKIL